MADFENVNVTDEMANVAEVNNQQLDAENEGFGVKMLKWGLFTATTGFGVAGGIFLADKIINGGSEFLERKAAGWKARREAEAKVKAEQKERKEKEAKKNDIPTSEEGEKVLEETKG